MNDLDKKLQEIATTNWEQFMEIVGPEILITAKARILRKEGKSYQQICIKLEMTESQARYACKTQKAINFNGDTKTE